MSFTSRTSSILSYHGRHSSSSSPSTSSRIMDALLTILTGLTLRLSLPLLSRGGDVRVHAALIGLWEGVVIHYFTNKAHRSRRRADMYIGFVTRLFVDLIITESPLRLALVIIWTGIGMIVADIAPGLFRDTGLERKWRRLVRDLRVLRWDVLSTMKPKARSSTRRSRTGGTVRFEDTDTDTDTASTLISPSATTPSSRTGYATPTATRQSTTGYAPSTTSSRSYVSTSSTSSASTATPHHHGSRSSYHTARRTIAPVPGYFPGGLMSETETEASAPRSPSLSNLPPLPPSLPTSDQPSDPDDLYASDSSDDTEVPLDIPDMFTGGPLEPVLEEYPPLNNLPSHEDWPTQEEYYTQQEYATPAFSAATSSHAPSVAPPSTSHFETPNDVVAPPESDVPEIEDEHLPPTPPRTESPELHVPALPPALASNRGPSATERAIERAAKLGIKPVIHKFHSVKAFSAPATAAPTPRVASPGRPVAVVPARPAPHRAASASPRPASAASPQPRPEHAKRGSADSTKRVSRLGIQEAPTPPEERPLSTGSGFWPLFSSGPSSKSSKKGPPSSAASEAPDPNDLSFLEPPRPPPVKKSKEDAKRAQMRSVPEGQEVLGDAQEHKEQQEKAEEQYRDSLVRDAEFYDREPCEGEGEGEGQQQADEHLDEQQQAEASAIPAHLRQNPADRTPPPSYALANPMDEFVGGFYVPDADQQGAASEIGAPSQVGAQSNVGGRSNVGGKSARGAPSTVGGQSNLGSQSAVGAPSTVGGQSNVGRRSSVGGQSNIGAQSNVGGRSAVAAQSDVGAQSSVGGRSAVGAQSNAGVQSNVGTQSNVGGRSALGGRSDVGGRSSVGGRSAVGPSVVGGRGTPSTVAEESTQGGAPSTVGGAPSAVGQSNVGAQSNVGSKSAVGGQSTVGGKSTPPSAVGARSVAAAPQGRTSSPAPSSVGRPPSAAGVPLPPSAVGAPASTVAGRPAQSAAGVPLPASSVGGFAQSAAGRHAQSAAGVPLPPSIAGTRRPSAEDTRSAYGARSTYDHDDDLDTLAPDDSASMAPVRAQRQEKPQLQQRPSRGNLWDRLGSALGGSKPVERPSQPERRGSAESTAARGRAESNAGRTNAGGPASVYPGSTFGRAETEAGRAPSQAPGRAANQAPGASSAVGGAPSVYPGSTWGGAQSVAPSAIGGAESAVGGAQSVAGGAPSVYPGSTWGKPASSVAGGRAESEADAAQSAVGGAPSVYPGSTWGGAKSVAGQTTAPDAAKSTVGGGRAESVYPGSTFGKAESVSPGSVIGGGAGAKSVYPGSTFGTLEEQRDDEEVNSGFGSGLTTPEKRPQNIDEVLAAAEGEGEDENEPIEDDTEIPDTPLERAMYALNLEKPKEGEAPAALRRRKTRVSRIVHEMLDSSTLTDSPKDLEFVINGTVQPEEGLRRVEQRVATLVARQLSLRSAQGSVHSGDEKGDDAVLTVTVPKGVKGGPLKRKITNGLKEKKLQVTEDKNNARVLSVVIPHQSLD